MPECELKRMSLKNKPNWMGKTHQILTIHKEVQTSTEYTEWEKSSTQGRVHQLVIQY